MKRVAYIFPTSHHYRVPFHEHVRDLLAKEQVEYTVIYGDPDEDSQAKFDTLDIAWGRKVAVSHLAGGLVYQHALREALQCDLVIIQQENRLLLNYVFNILSTLGFKKVAFFGHGRNFQSRKPAGRTERFKRFWATKVDWWFGYTQETRAHLQSLGFPKKRITVFNNSVDTATMREQVAASNGHDRSALAAQLGLMGSKVGVFVGGIYPDKRIPFLIKAADRIRERLHDFELIIVGGGSDLPLAQSLAQSRPWVHVTGPRFGQEKVDLMLLGHVFMMPGLMGLAILDAGIAGLAIATTQFPWHSPEIAYLEPSISGIKVAEWANELAYADEVVRLFEDPGRLKQMRENARAMADRYSIEAMARNFADGVMKALAV